MVIGVDPEPPRSFVRPILATAACLWLMKLAAACRRTNSACWVNGEIARGLERLSETALRRRGAPRLVPRLIALALTERDKGHGEAYESLGTPEGNPSRIGNVSSY